MLMPWQAEDHPLFGCRRRKHGVPLEAFAIEREIIIEDLNDLSLQVADKAMGHIKGIIRSVLLFGIILILLLFGLPFLGGFYLGKYIQRSKSKNIIE